MEGKCKEEEEREQEGKGRRRRSRRRGRRIHEHNYRVSIQGLFTTNENYARLTPVKLLACAENIPIFGIEKTPHHTHNQE